MMYSSDLSGKSVKELEAIFRSEVKRLPLQAPIFLPTERVPLRDAIAGLRRVNSICADTLDAVYRRKLQNLRRQHMGQKRCFIIGNGPSLNAMDLAPLANEVTFAVNGFFLKSKELGWTPTYYVVEDHLVAEDRKAWIDDFKGPTKLFPAYLGYCFEENDETIFFNHRPRKSYPTGFDFSKEADAITYAGCTVTFTCMQLAYYMGFEEIYLIGVDASYSIPEDADKSVDYSVGVLDMQSDDVNHFHPDYFGKGFRWHDPQVGKMLEAYEVARQVTDETDQTIFNAGVGGELNVFKRVEYSKLFSGKTPSRSPEDGALARNSTRFPKVLIYDITRVGDGTATGEVKKNLFMDWPTERLGQVYSGGEDKIRWSSQSVDEQFADLQHAAEVAAEFDPDLILYRPVMDNLHLHQAAMCAIKSLRKPVVTWFMDDWMERFKAERPVEFLSIEDDLDCLLKCSFKTLSIGKHMSEAFAERYGRKFIPIANGVDPAHWPLRHSGKAGSAPFRIRYAGSLAENMTLESLVVLAEAIEALSYEIDIVFEIKTRKLWFDRVFHRFEGLESVRFVTDDLSSENYRLWLQEADALIIAYNFDESSIRYTRYSVANKLPECLASGVPLIAIGPATVATIQLLKEYQTSLVLTHNDSDLVKTEIRDFIKSPNLRKEMSEAGRVRAFERHNIFNLRGRLKNEALYIDGVSETEANHSAPAIIIGNGPSLRGFEFSKLSGFTTFGSNAAYRYWNEINWFPDYYSCLDVVVGMSHREEIKRLIENAHQNGIRRFLLRDNLVAELGQIKNSERIFNFDVLSKSSDILGSTPITTGSHSAAWAAYLGYRRIYLMGVDGRYVEHVDGAKRSGKNKLKIRQKKPNPNYFFDNYQEVGDEYMVPNPNQDVHVNAWQGVASGIAAYSNSKVMNTNLNSQINCFDFCFLDGVLYSGKDAESEFHGDRLEATKALPVKEPAELLSQVRFSRSDKANIDETRLIAKLYENSSPGLMVDVGAHSGSSAIHFATQEWLVYCFEPDPKNRAHLKKLLGESPNVKIDKRAVAEVPELSKDFYSSSQSSGISGLLKFHETHKRSLSVDVTSIKAFTEENKITHISFLKIDVEGFDFSVLKGVPWDAFSPDIIECEFEDEKTKHLGHSWSDICDFLVGKGYTLYVSEWHPIVEYGIRHDWMGLKRYPCALESDLAWGNLLAFKTDPGEEALYWNLGEILEFENFATETSWKNLLDKKRTHNKAIKKLMPPKPMPQINNNTRSLPVQTKSSRIVEELRLKNPVLGRIAQLALWFATFVRSHIRVAIAASAILASLLLLPLVFSGLRPFALWFWCGAVLMLLAAAGSLALAFVNEMANRIAEREQSARQVLKNDIVRLVRKLDETQNRNLDEVMKSLAKLTDEVRQLQKSALDKDGEP